MTYDVFGGTLNLALSIYLTFQWCDIEAYLLSLGLKLAHNT